MSRTGVVERGGEVAAQAVGADGVDLGVVPGEPGYRDRLVASSLPAVSLVLSMVFLLTWGVDVGLREVAWDAPAPAAFLALGGVFLGFFVVLRWRGTPAGWGHPLAFSMVVLALSSTVASHVVQGRALAPVGLVLAALGSGVLLLSLGWLLASLAAVGAFLLTFVALDPGNPLWVPLSLLLVGAGALGIVVQRQRVRGLERVARLRARDAEQAEALQDALDEARRLREVAEDRVGDAGQAVEELKRRNESMEKVTRRMVDGLREPLRDAREHLSRVRGAGVDDPEANQALRGAHVAVGSAERALRGMRQIVRVERAGSSMAPVDLAGVVEDVLGDLTSRVAATNAHVAVEGELPRVMAMEEEVRILVRHLVDNALRYGGREPTVRIRAGDPGETTGRIRVVVEDDGPGVPEDLREVIFERFQRGPGTGDVPGAGLGLAVCKRIVEKHGGRLWVEDAPAGGARFCFTMNPVRGIAGGA